MSDSRNAAAVAIQERFQELSEDYDKTQDNIVRLQSHQRQLLTEIDAYVVAARHLGLELKRPPTVRASGNGQSIKALILQMVEDAYPQPVQAGDVRRQLTGMGYAIHERTVDMTLYRWGTAGRVKRDGHGWYFIPRLAAVAPRRTQHRPELQQERILEPA